MSISSYLRDATGLPVDFQIQRYSNVKDGDWEKHRDSMNMSNFKKPPWIKENKNEY